MQARLNSGETLMDCGVRWSEWPPVTWNQNACIYCTALALCWSLRLEPQQINDHGLRLLKPSATAADIVTVATGQLMIGRTRRHLACVTISN